LDDITEGTVIIRSHGVGKKVLDECLAKGLAIADATCPHVKRMHRMVAEAEAGMPVIIVGQADHPEVRGTAGWARGPVKVVGSVEEARALPEIDQALAAAQTTISDKLYRAVIGALRERVGRLKVLETVCPATARRQDEAKELAQWADIMLVVGSGMSSNTRELARTCREYCPDTRLVETVGDLELGNSLARPRPGLKVGVTAGASTPDWLYKEVINRMNDIDNAALANADPQAQETVAQVSPQKDAAAADADANASFLADIEATLVKIRPGQTVTGTVVQVADDEICVNIGYKSDGVVRRGDLVSENVKVGDEIDVEVVKVNDGEGNVLLSQRNVVSRKNWEILINAYEANEYVEGVGKEVVKGGLVANVMNVRAFVPASHLSPRYVEKIGDYVGKPMKLKIIDVDRGKKRIVCSRKAVIVEEAAARKKEAWGKLEEGMVLTGTVRRLTDFGAFVDVGGVDGLVHVTDLAWGRVRHASEIVQPGQEIAVKVLSLDEERDRIQLGHKQTQPKPWEVAEEKYPAGLVVEGKVVRVVPFGAFVELEPGLDGLVHISQCALSRIAKVEEVVEVGQMVRVKVLNVDPVARRISLSIRAVLEDEAFIYSNEIPGEFDAAYSDEPDLVE
jgi:4-hydroxy-3-methylbut-2-enyl diphosphate reductase